MKKRKMGYVFDYPLVNCYSFSRYDDDTNHLREAICGKLKFEDQWMQLLIYKNGI
ncbi:hypothetical protein [Methanobacterium alcaliphilum]|uniref:hypothetical protein n=1 Tax=Methanobacterium alcaliphilum TaxID=392018 RepID=UPI00200B7334|nr:hypothetical protein [Methanobacterium alcaliphilum]MCK9151978.1 hypothetical protein [Methanobacterium alcaliphilum]